jgi:hypothetical protein
MDRSQRLSHPVFHFLVRQALVQWTVGHVIEDCGGEELVVGRLEDHAYQGAHPAEGGSGDFQVAYPHTTLPAQDTVEVQDEGRLSRSIRPNQGYFFPRLDGQ